MRRSARPPLPVPLPLPALPSPPLHNINCIPRWRRQLLDTVAIPLIYIPVLITISNPLLPLSDIPRSLHLHLHHHSITTIIILATTPVNPIPREQPADMGGLIHNHEIQYVHIAPMPFCARSNRPKESAIPRPLCLALRDHPAHTGYQTQNATPRILALQLPSRPTPSTAPAIILRTPDISHGLSPTPEMPPTIPTRPWQSPKFKT